MPKQTKRNIDIATSMVALAVAILILVINASGYTYEPKKSAKATGAATVTTGDSSGTTPASSDLAGNVSNSTTAITARGFEYGTDTGYGSAISDSSPKSPYNFLYQFSTIDGGLSNPIASSIGSNGYIYSVGSGFGDSVLTIKNQNGSLIRTLNNTNGTAFGQLRAVASDSTNNIYVADYAAQKIYKLQPNGDYIGDFSTPGYPLGLALDGSNNIYVSILANGIYKYVDMGVTPPTSISSPTQPIALTVDSSNNLYASSNANVVYKINNSGTVVQTIGAGELNDPLGIGVNAENKLYVADTGNSRTQIFNSDGTLNSSILGISNDASFDSSDYLYLSIGNYPTFSGIKKYSPVPTYTNGDYSLTLNDLNCGTTYHYRAFATNGDGSTDYGEDRTFTTGACMVVTTNPAGGAEATSIDLSGDISFSANTLTNRGFQWGDTTEYGNQLADPTENPPTGNYILNLTGLTCNSTYHYRAYGTNSNGTYYGNDQSFSTAPCPTMSVHTDGVSNSTTSSADLNGIISDSNTSITQRGFQWGATAEYGNTLADESQNIPTSSVLQFGSLGSGNAQFNSPQGIRTDSSGNVYVADSINNRIQKFNASGAYIGQIGEFGGGDGQFWNPQDVLVDSSDNLYVSDSNNNRIQKFNSFGIFQSSFSTSSPIGMAFTSAGNIVTTDLNNSKAYIYDTSGGEIANFGSAGSANGEFNAPRGVAVDTDDNIYIADTFNDRVQKFNSSGSYQSQVGGSGDGNGQFNRPYYVAIDPSSKLYVTDIYNNRVQIFATDLSYISKFGQSGYGAGDLSQPTGITISNTGNIYVSENNNNRVQEFSTQASFSQGSYSLNLSGLTCQPYHFRAYGTNAGGTFYGEDAVFNPCMTIRTNPANNIGNFGADLNGSVLNSASTISARGFQWGTTTEYGNIAPSNNPSYHYQNNLTINSAGGISPDTLSNPSWTVSAPNGDIYVVDQGNNRILQYNSSGGFIASHGEYGSELGQFNSPNSLAFDSFGNIYVTDGGNTRVQKFNSSFADPTLLDSSSCPDGSFTNPIGIAIDGSNNIYVTDVNTARILIIGGDSSCIKITNEAMASPVGIALSPAGFIVVTDSGANAVRAFNPDGSLLGSVTVENTPVGVAVDSSNNIYVSRLFGNDVVKINPIDGSSESIFSISNPIGLSLDASGNVLVASAGSGSAQRFVNTPYYNTGFYTVSLGSLSCGTTYHFRAYATNETDTYYGEDQSFTTNSCMDIYTNDAQNITDTSADLYGDISNSITEVSIYGFQIGTTLSYGQNIVASEDFTPGEYSLQASSLAPCTTYHFRAFGTNQNGTYYGDDNTFTTACNPVPPTPPTPTPAPSGGSTSPAGTSFSGGSVPIITSESVINNAESGSTNQSTQPTKANGFFGTLLLNLENLAKRIPKPLAIAIPYLLIFLLLILALLYYILSYSEYRNSKKYRELISRYNNLLTGGQNFIALTSHYLNSPVSTMQVAAGILIADKTLTRTQGEAIMRALHSINKSTNELLNHNSQSTSRILEGIDSEPQEIKTGRYLLSPLVWIPIVIATILLITANLLFFRANVFAINLYSISSQILLLIVGILLVLMGWRSYRRNRLLEQRRQRALIKERALARAKTNFIKKASGGMKRDLKIIEQASNGLRKHKQAKELLAGLATLTAVETSLDLLEKFNSYTPSGQLGTKDFKRAIDSAIKESGEDIAKKNLELHSHIKGGISAKIDYAALSLIISSTINNAVKFNRKNGKIDIYVEHSKGQTIFEVKDTGVGIDKDKLESILSPFSRATNAMKFDYEGLGVSLYMNRIITDQIGGHLQIKSKPGKGTKVIIGMPK